MTDLPPAVPAATPFDLLPHASTAARDRIRLADVGTLPPTLDLTTAGRLLGIGRSTAYALAQQGKFPCTTFKVGHQHRVATAALLRLIGIAIPEPEQARAPFQAE